MIEDNPGDAGLVREALEEYAVRCELTVIDNGELALEFIESFVSGESACPDLIILDLNLPKRPGTDILGRIRESSNCNHIPIVVLSSSDSQKDKDEVAALGAFRYVRKPSRLAEFLKLGGVFRDMLRGQSK